MVNVIYANGDGSKQMQFEDHIVDSLKVEHPLLEKVFPGVEFFVVTSCISLPPVRRLLGYVNGNRYDMPMLFNILFKKVEKKSRATFFERMKAFVLLTGWENTFDLREDEGHKIESYKVEVYDLKPVSEEDKKKYQKYSNECYEMKVKYNDNESLWIIWMKDNQIKHIEMYYKGKRSNMISPFSSFLKSREVDIQITGGNFNHETHIHPGPPPYPMQHYYVIVSEDGSATNDYIVFEVTGLQPNQENAYLQVKSIDVYGDSLFLDQLLTVDNTGSANYSWTPPNNNNTGFCLVQVDTSGTKIKLEDTWIIPEHTKTGTFTSGYDYTIHYCNQFFAGQPPNPDFPPHPLGIAHASTFVGYVETALTESWDKQVRDWILAQGCSSQGFNDVPIDDDGNYQICINDHDPTHLYHGTETNQASINDYRKIGIRYDSHLTDSLYTNEEIRIKVAMAHEFYHGIQMSHNPISSYGSHFTEMFWMIEGQARFLPSVQYKSEEFYVETVQHFFPKDANLYLSSTSPLYLNSSLHDLSYRYCLFWRLLFENYTTGSIADSLAIIRETCRGNTNHNLPDIEAFMDSELTGTYETMDDVIKDFAKNCYLNDPSYNLWNPCPSDSFYVTPFITASHRNGITNTFTGERNITESDNIAEPFGIDYMIFNIGAGVTNVCLIFDGDPDDNGNMADFYVNTLLMEGNDIISEQEISLTNGEGVISFETNDPVNKVVLIIARLDSDETSENDYEVTLSDDEMHISGNVSGTWTNTYSTYFIDGEITVPLGDTLIIEPGIKVNFSGHYKFNIYGRLVAEGEEHRYIFFTAQDTTIGWHGLRFIDQNTNGQDSSILSYCKLQYGKATGYFPEFNGGAIYCDDSSPIIEDCLFINNSANGGGGAMCLYNWSSPEIRRTRFAGNHAPDGGAIFVCNPEGGYSWPYFEEVVFDNNIATNAGGAIYLYKNVFPILINLTFFQNSATHMTGGGAIYCDINCNFHIHNSILWQDATPELYLWSGCTIHVHNCDLTNGTGSYIMGLNNDITFDGNILSSDPRFVDANNGNFNLDWTSPCIDMGAIVEETVRNKKYKRNRDDDGTLPDIGARSYYQKSEIDTPTDLVISTEQDSIYLDWTHGDGAIFYKIFESLEPYNYFTVIDTIFGKTEYSKLITNNFNFYQIIGGNNRTE